MIIDIIPSARKDKRFTAIFKDGSKTSFGQKGGSTYIDHKDKEKKKNYRARHERDLETKDPKRAGYLSYYILWGDETNLKDAMKAYNKHFFSN